MAQTQAAEPRRHVIHKTPSAARYLNVSPPTLERWRQQGTGPKFIRVGLRGVRYLESDLDAYVEAQRRSSTSDLDGDTATISDKELEAIRAASTPTRRRRLRETTTP